MKIVAGKHRKSRMYKRFSYKIIDIEGLKNGNIVYVSFNFVYYIGVLLCLGK